MATPAIFMIEKRTCAKFIILSLQYAEISLIRNNILTISRNFFQKDVDIELIKKRRFDMLPKPDPELTQYFRNYNEWDMLKKLLCYLRCLLNILKRRWY